MLFVYYAFHILYLSYTFRVIDTLFLILVYLSYTFLYKAHIHIFFYYLVFVFVSYVMNASMHYCIPIFIYISLYSHILLSHVCIISFMHFYHDLAILVLSIFLSCMILLIHISIYVPIVRVLVLITVFCHLLLLSIVLSIYAFLSFVLSMFYLFI